MSVISARGRAMVEVGFPCCESGTFLPGVTEQHGASVASAASSLCICHD